MNKNHFKMMRVTSVKVSVDKEGFNSRIKRGLCMIDLTQIQHVEYGEGQTEVVMKTGDRFNVENITFDELVVLLRDLKE